MVFATSILTGLFTAMLRSLFAVIMVAFLLSMTLVAALLFNGASVLALVLAVFGFNAGLIAVVAAHVIHSRPRSA